MIGMQTKYSSQVFCSFRKNSKNWLKQVKYSKLNKWMSKLKKLTILKHYSITKSERCTIEHHNMGNIKKICWVRKTETKDHIWHESMYLKYPKHANSKKQHRIHRNNSAVRDYRRGRREKVYSVRNDVPFGMMKCFSTG